MTSRTSVDLHATFSGTIDPDDPIDVHERIVQKSLEELSDSLFEYAAALRIENQCSVPDRIVGAAQLLRALAEGFGAPAESALARFYERALASARDCSYKHGTCNDLAGQARKLRDHIAEQLSGETATAELLARSVALLLGQELLLLWVELPKCVQCEAEDLAPIKRIIADVLADNLHRGADDLAARVIKALGYKRDASNFFERHPGSRRPSR